MRVTRKPIMHRQVKYVPSLIVVSALIMIIMTETTGSIIPTATRQCTSHGVHNKYINVQSAAEFRLFFDAADIDRPLLAGGLVCLSVCLSQIGM